MVGGLNTIFGYSVFALLISLELHYTIATFLSTILGIIFNFKTTGKLVFKSNNNSLIIKFTSVYMVVYLINISLLWLLKSVSINLYIAGAILLLPTAILSFSLNSKYVFKENVNESY
jgi:putative flippase GtrA